MLASFAHSRTHWDISASEGTRTSTTPPCPTIVSAIFNAVNVLPVPQAMTTWPRSLSLKPSTTFSRACSWCSRIFFLAGFSTFPLVRYLSQSISRRRIRRSGMCAMLCSSNIRGICPLGSTSDVWMKYALDETLRGGGPNQFFNISLLDICIGAHELTLNGHKLIAANSSWQQDQRRGRWHPRRAA